MGVTNRDKLLLATLWYIFFLELSARLNEMQEKCHAVEARRLERQRVIDAEAKEDINKQLLIANIKLSILTLWQYVISKKVKKTFFLFLLTKPNQYSAIHKEIKIKIDIFSANFVLATVMKKKI